MENTIIQISESMDKILPALFEVQSSSSGPAKTSYNPFHKSKYADLSSVLDAIHEPMTKAKLFHTSAHSVSLDRERNPAYQNDWRPKTNKEQNGVQPPPEIFICWVIVETTILHISGQWVRGSIKLRSVDSTSQAIGSCITYGRRYNLLAMAGLAPADDDGNSASGKKETKEQNPNKAFRKNNKELRCDLNQDLAKQTTEDGFQVVYTNFTDKYGGDILKEHTTFRQNETFKSIFDEHWNRIQNLKRSAPVKEEAPQDEVYNKWESSLKNCKTEKQFRPLEKEYIDNLDSWENEYAEGLLNSTGKRLKLKDYSK